MIHSALLLKISLLSGVLYLRIYFLSKSLLRCHLLCFLKICCSLVFSFHGSALEGIESTLHLIKCILVFNSSKKGKSQFTDLEIWKPEASELWAARRSHETLDKDAIFTINISCPRSARGHRLFSNRAPNFHRTNANGLAPIVHASSPTPRSKVVGQTPVAAPERYIFVVASMFVDR